ncbi:cleavage and polyadenylation specificity factor, putative [Babesia caballi]|uniref:Cleavage and polyadenylation specificity factor, putative n=1 Tax=Babesia caballi TaxID=5871 RepID=A0AAV4LVZ2_BABCB|nr:cleavage and polyadenylation specificity factor, putative [Babesia caballi]
MEITILGAGQDVGRSCVVVTFPSRRVLFDCGAHCGFVDHRRYPSLQLLGDPNMYSMLYNEEMNAAYDSVAAGPTGSSDAMLVDAPPASSDAAEPQGSTSGSSGANAIRDKSLRVANCMKNALMKTLTDVTNYIDFSVISHFHLDHIGAMPFLTEHLGYKGPVFMTYPTRGLAPILLRDSAQVVASKFRNTVDTEGAAHGLNVLLNRTKRRKRMTVEQLGKFDPWGYTVDCVAESLGRAHIMQLRETLQLGGVKITPYYAGHVLGASMFHVECDGLSVLYTGDFNSTPDKHLGSARVPPLKPDVLICESTYASVVRQPRRATEMELCTAVHDCLMGGGKVLIPVFAVGRAQELAIILDAYWTKLQLQFPIYFGGGMSERATTYYKLHSAWTDSRNIPNLAENPFALKHMLPFDNSFLKDDRPMVLFATPGMVHSGLSLKVCKLWGPNPKNLIVIPGYAAQGTVGNKLISGEKVIHCSTGTFEVKCKVRYLSFSAHADSAGIMRLIKQVQPRHLVLVHGEYEGMKKFAKHIAMEIGIPVSHPANGQTIVIKRSKPEATAAVYYHQELVVEASGLLLSNDKLDDTFDFGVKELEFPPNQIPALLFRFPRQTGVQPEKTCDGTAVAPAAIDMEMDRAEKASESRETDTFMLVSKRHLGTLIRDVASELPIGSGIRCHRIKHRQRLKCTTMQFVEATEFVAKLLHCERGFFAEELPMCAETLDSGVKVLKVGGLEVRHDPRDNTAALQWYQDEMRPNSIVYTLVHMLRKLAQ